MREHNACLADAVILVLAKAGLRRPFQARPEQSIETSCPPAHLLCEASPSSDTLTAPLSHRPGLARRIQHIGTSRGDSKSHLSRHNGLDIKQMKAALP